MKQAGLTDEEAQGAIYYPYVHRTDDSLFVARPREPAARIARVDAAKGRPANRSRAAGQRSPVDGRPHRRQPGRPPLAGAAGGLFSGIALLLTAIGTYGVLSYAVAQRRREIGVRMALGARPEQIRGQFFSLALRLLAGGTILGLIGAWLTGRAMQAVLFHVPGSQPGDTRRRSRHYRGGISCCMSRSRLSRGTDIANAGSGRRVGAESSN